jgi:hypothetical protein
MEQATWVSLLHSRKFWVLIVALVGIAAGFATGQIDAWQAIQAAVAALAAYSTGVAIEDAGFKAGGGNTSSPALLRPYRILRDGAEKGAEVEPVEPGAPQACFAKDAWPTQAGGPEQSAEPAEKPTSPLPKTAGLPPAPLHGVPLQDASRERGAEAEQPLPNTAELQKNG